MKCVDAGARVAPVAMSDVPVAAYPRGRWTLFKNPFVKCSKPAVPAAPVQGELLLDLVRPVRNDLCDSDLEVVPARATVATPLTPNPSGTGAGPGLATASSSFAAAPARPDSRLSGEPGEPGEPAPAEWGRVTTQLFGAGKT